MTIKLFAAIGFLILQTVSLAAPLPATLVSAINALSESASNDWAYTRETSDETGVYTERFDPSLPKDQQWQLLSFENRTPTEKDLKRYASRYEELFERDSPTHIDLSALIDPDTLEVLGESNDILEYAFRPLSEDEADEKIMPYLRGTIQIDRQKQHVLQVDIRNTKAFKPAAVVKIKHIWHHMKFSVADDDRTPVIVLSESATEGRLMGLKKFAETEVVAFSDFVYRDVLAE